MKLILRASYLLLGLTFSNISMADITCNGTTSCFGPAEEVITGLFPRPVGGVLIEVAPTVVSSLPCAGASGGNNVLLADTHSSYKETYATLLTASVSGKQVTIRIDESESSCTLSYAKMSN